MKFSRRAVTYPGQHTLHDGRTSDILHRLTFLGRASKNCSVVAMSVSPTPTVPIFLAWRSYNAIVSNIGKFVNLWCLISLQSSPVTWREQGPDHEHVDLSYARSLNFQLTYSKWKTRPYGTTAGLIRNSQEKGYRERRG